MIVKTGRLTWWPVVVLALAFWPSTTPSAAGEAAGDLPYELRVALTEPLNQRVRALLQEKNEDGLSFRRGSFSHSFRRLDDSTYQVTFHEDTATRDRLKTERFLLTLRGSEDGEGWRIAERELEDTYEGLLRTYPGDEQFHRFDAFSLDLEGLVITASAGSLYTDYLNEEPYRLVITADRMYQKYVPSPALSFHGRQVYAYLKEKEPEKFDFEAERVTITCSPAECGKILEGAFKGLRAVPLDRTDAALKKTYLESTEDQQRRLEERGFHGFSTPFEPERRFIALVARKKGADDRVWLIRDNWSGWEVRLGASEYGSFLGYYSAETVAGGVSPHDLESRADLDGRHFDLTGLEGTVGLALKDHSTMTGDVTFRLVTRRALRELPFSIARLARGGGSKSQNLNPSLVVNSIQDEDGRELTWVRLGSAGGVVVLPEELPEGSALALRFQFENSGAIYKLTQSYSRVARGGWLPFVRPSDAIDKFDLTVKVPSRYKTLGTGKKVSETTDGAVTTTRWVADTPVNFPTIIFGDYVERTPAFQAERSDGSPIAVTIHVDRDGMTDWNIRPKQLQPLAEQAANSLNLFREIFGVDYPYAKLDLVNDPQDFLGGQSPASIVYLGSAAFRGEGILVAALGPGVMKSVRSLVAHEVGHQWWGGLVTHANQRNYWFVESMAEYASALYLEALNGREDPEKGWKAYLHEVKLWHEQIVHAGLFGSVQDASSLNGGSYGAALYAKGPYAIHMMRMTFGDEKFFAFLRKLARELAGREIVTQDIQEVAEESFGVPMDWFFDQWIRGIGLPEYEIIYTTRATEDGKHLIEGTVNQRVLVGSEKWVIEDTYFRAIVPITVIGKRSKEEYTIRVALEGRETPFMFKVPERPGKVVLNRYGEVLSRVVSVKGEKDRKKNR